MPDEPQTPLETGPSEPAEGQPRETVASELAAEARLPPEAGALEWPAEAQQRGEDAPETPIAAQETLETAGAELPAEAQESRETAAAASLIEGQEPRETAALGPPAAGQDPREIAVVEPPAEAQSLQEAAAEWPAEVQPPWRATEAESEAQSPQETAAEWPAEVQPPWGATEAQSLAEAQPPQETPAEWPAEAQPPWGATEAESLAEAQPPQETPAEWPAEVQRPLGITEAESLAEVQPPHETTAAQAHTEAQSVPERGEGDKLLAPSPEVLSGVPPPRRRPILGILITFAVVALALGLGWAAWDAYVGTPWTRDGTVRVYVVTMAPEVAGRIVELPVGDNQFVHKGDLLMRIDPTDYKIAVSLAEAAVEQAQANSQNSMTQAARRRKLTTMAAPEEEKQNFATNAQVARAQYQQAVANLDQARVNLKRAEIHSPVNGWITNLLAQRGDYAVVGVNKISVIDADSFWIDAYFEETNLGSIREGDQASIRLMGYSEIVRGHVGSVARGINVPNAEPNGQGLANVNPIFTWVRLAQRIPVRIHIDDVPHGVRLAAGLTATVQLESRRQSGGLENWVKRLRLEAAKKLELR